MSQAVHHRSLASSAVALAFGFVALAFVPEHQYRLQEQGDGYLLRAAAVAVAGLTMCTFTLIVLLRDNRSGYPAMRGSLAALFWAIACVPVLLLTIIVFRGLTR